jgi:hypothetical protein
MYRGTGSRQARWGGSHVMCLGLCTGLGMEHGACVYTNRTHTHTHTHTHATRAQSPISTISLLRPSTVNKIGSCSMQTAPARIRMHNSLIHLSTHPSAASDSKQHFSESGPWLCWLAGVVGPPALRLAHVLPGSSQPVTVSVLSVALRPFRFAPLRAFAFCFSGRRCRRACLAVRLQVAAARTYVRCAVWSRERGGCLESPTHTHTLCPLVVCTVTEVGR